MNNLIEELKEEFDIYCETHDCNNCRYSNGCFYAWLDANYDLSILDYNYDYDYDIYDNDIYDDLEEW